MLQTTAVTKLLLAILAILTAFAAFQTHQAMEARQRADAVQHQLDQERARFWSDYERQRKQQPLDWGHAAESIGGFRLRNEPPKKGKQ